MIHYTFSLRSLVAYKQLRLDYYYFGFPLRTEGELRPEEVPLVRSKRDSPGGLR